MPPASDNPARRDFLGAFACIAVAVFVLALSWHKIESLDTGYHLAYGQHFLTHGKIVDRDPFLLPQNAVTFVNANWGSQIIMAIAHRAAGSAGLIALRTALTIITFAAIALVLRQFTRSLLWLAATWLLAGAAAYERFGLRPELFSYAIMLPMLALLARPTLTRRRAVAIVILQIAWVNLHSYFLVGLFIAGAFLLPDLIASLTGARDPVCATTLRTRLWTFGAQLIACFFNPWGWRGASFPIETLSYLRRTNAMAGGPNDTAISAWSLISEFHSPFRYVGEFINARTMHAYYVLLAVVVIGLIACLIRRRFAPMLLLILFAAMSFQMRRNIAQFALAGAPLALGAIAARRLVAPVRTSAVAPVSNRCPVPQVSNLRSLAQSIILTALSLWWTVGLVNGRFYYSERRITRQFGTGYSSRTFTTDAVNWLAAQPSLQPNLFVDYFSSSNTLPWLPDRFKLFVDTNTFAYKEETLAAAFDLGLAKRPHADIFDRDAINVALLHVGPDTQPLVMRLVADYTNWALVYFDPQAVIFARRIPAHVDVIKANHPAAADLDPKKWIAAYDEPAYTKALSLGTAVNVPLALGYHAAAAELMREAVRLAPDYHDAWYFLAICEANLGQAAAKAGNLSDARAHIREAKNAADTAVTLMPSHAPSRALANDMAAMLQ
ncbi:MAG: hypothetical protein HZA51_16110 [Planctomycetes bacterium]|nr:hypothetical protein [Planctomycetota bacterium]